MPSAALGHYNTEPRAVLPGHVRCRWSDRRHARHRHGDEPVDGQAPEPAAPQLHHDVGVEADALSS